MRRRQLAATASGIGAALLAGCTGGGGGGGSGSDGGYGGGGGSGIFRLLTSGQPAAIEEFATQDVRLSSARVFRANGGDDITSAAVTPDKTETPEPTTDGGSDTTDQADNADN